MSKSNVVELSGRATIAEPLTELLRAGSEQLIYRTVEAELSTSPAIFMAEIQRVRTNGPGELSEGAQRDLTLSSTP